MSRLKILPEFRMMASVFLLSLTMLLRAEEPKTASFTNVFKDAPVGTQFDLNADSIFVLSSLLRHRETILKHIDESHFLSYVIISATQTRSTDSKDIFRYRLGFREGSTASEDPKAKVSLTNLRFDQTITYKINKKKNEFEPKNEAWKFPPEANEDKLAEMTEEDLAKNLIPKPKPEHPSSPVEICKPEIPGCFFENPSTSSILMPRADVIAVIDLCLKHFKKLKLDALFDKTPRLLSARVLVGDAGHILTLVAGHTKNANTRSKKSISVTLTQNKDGQTEFTSDEIQVLSPPKPEAVEIPAIPSTVPSTAGTQNTQTAQPQGQGQTTVQKKGGCATQPHTGAWLLLMGLTLYAGSAYRRRMDS